MKDNEPHTNIKISINKQIIGLLKESFLIATKSMRDQTSLGGVSRRIGVTLTRLHGRVGRRSERPTIAQWAMHASDYTHH
jgi:hypothetical protein